MKSPIDIVRGRIVDIDKHGIVTIKARYQITDTEKTIDMDKDGNPKPVRIKNTTKNIVPDTMAIMYWLNNRKRTQWAQRQEVALSAGDDSEDVLIYLPANGRDDGDQQES